MKVKSVFITSAFALASLSASASGRTSEFLEIFEPYIGSSFSVRCGETLSKARSAEKQEGVLEFEERGNAPALKLQTRDHFFYFGSLDTRSDRYSAPYGGDLGGKTISITNEIDGNVFTQTRVEKDGLIFKSKSFEMESSIDFSNAKELIYSGNRNDFSNDPVSEEVCLLQVRN